MSDMILTTFDWVPEMPRGYGRDLRVRWALEEAGLPYRVESTLQSPLIALAETHWRAQKWPRFRDRKAGHFEHQAFGQVPLVERW